MYEVLKNNKRFALTDTIIYVEKNRNDIYVPCDPVKANGVVINNDFVEPIEGLQIMWFNGPAKLSAAIMEGAALAQASTEEPPATVGVLAAGFPEWEPGMVFEKQYSLFVHNGVVGFTRQPNITAQEHQPPLSTGMESVYGVRPVPDGLGVYPYVYNMAASVGMMVRDDAGQVWECYQGIDPVLYPPQQLAAHFRKVE